LIKAVVFAGRGRKPPILKNPLVQEIRHGRGTIKPSLLTTLVSNF